MIMNMKSRLVFAALALVAAGCGKNIEYDACGQVDATQVTVSAENAGRVLSMAVEEGEEVTAGQLLGALDSVQTYLQIMELRERIAGSSSRLVDIKKQGQPNLSQLENLQNEYERYSKLLEGNATTRKQVDDLTDKIAVLKAQIEGQLLGSSLPQHDGRHQGVGDRPTLVRQRNGDPSRLADFFCLAQDDIQDGPVDGAVR